MTTARRWAVIAAALLAGLAIACGESGSATPEPSTTAQPQGAGELGIAPRTTGLPAVTAQYPVTAQDYAEAIVAAAWSGPDLATLRELTTAQVTEEFTQYPPALDLTWHFARCIAGQVNWDCVFDNDDGDALTVSIQADRLGQTGAGVATTLDRTLYPDSAVPYVQEFVDAWRDGNAYRMSKLATSTVISLVADQSPPASGYAACGDATAGTTYVRVYGGGGPQYVFAVSDGRLGDSDAVIDELAPPDPPACFSIMVGS
jgi:hypothetical protein